MKKILIAISLLLIGISTKSLAADEYYLECDGCSNIQMKLKAQTAPLVGQYITAHVFNESDMLYRRYRVYNEIVGSGEEAMTQISSYPLAPTQKIRIQFEEYIIAKRNLENAIGFRQFIMDGDGAVTLTNNFESLNNTEHASSVSSASSSSSTYTTQDSTSQFFTTQSSSNEAGCDGRGPAKETTEDHRTAHDYMKNSQFRQELFNKIKQRFDVSGVGNMPEFFEKHNKFFKTLKESGIDGVSQVGGILSVIGEGASTISVITPDNGKMEITLNFKRTTANVVFAKDGDCNVIPLNSSEADLADFTFDSVDGERRMIERLQGFGRVITGTHESWKGFRCVKRQINCRTDYDGTRSCSRGKCLGWVSAR